MAIEIIDGCKVYVNGKKLVIINSDCISKCMNVYKKHNFDGVAVSIYHDYKIQNVDFFKAFPEIKHISISEGISDISGIYGIPALRSAIISGKNKRIDFSFFPLLEVLNADWSPHFKNLDKCLKMNSLSIHHYNPKNTDFTDISQLFWIRKLKISQSNIYSFHGLEQYNQLEELEFNYCGKLEKLCSLEKSTKSLKSLTFDHCKAIKNHEYITNLKVLSTLAFNYCGNLSSIKFIKDLNSLENFIFSNTDVIDGDVSPCIGLRYVYFTNKRHFSHKVEEIMSSSTLYNP